MTINVALVTSEGLVFGCDSTASTTDVFLQPFEFMERDESGSIILDDQGRATAKFEPSDLQWVVTNAWGGVTKMFQISEGPTPVVAVTAGTAKLNDRTIASLGIEFRDQLKQRKKKLVSVEPIAKAFLSFFRKQYDEHYADSAVPERFREGPEFLVGGYGRDARFPALFRVKVKENEIEQEFAGGRSGVAWNGQADAVERLLNGVDSILMGNLGGHIEDLLEKHHENMSSKMVGIIAEILDRLKEELPDDLDTTLPDKIDSDFSWTDYFIDTDFSNLPLQEAVNMASYLVLMQAGKARFERGVATVGGRVHIGVITKEDGFEVLNEPELTHRYVGFSDDPQ